MRAKWTYQNSFRLRVVLAMLLNYDLFNGYNVFVIDNIDQIRELLCLLKDNKDGRGILADCSDVEGAISQYRSFGDKGDTRMALRPFVSSLRNGKYLHFNRAHVKFYKDNFYRILKYEDLYIYDQGDFEPSEIDVSIFIQ